MGRKASEPRILFPDAADQEGVITINLSLGWLSLTAMPCGRDPERQRSNEFQ